MLGIIILNYNTWHESIECIESIRKYLCDYDYKIYLVDNKSPVLPTVEEEKFLCEIQNLILVKSDENRGYSAGNNIGIRMALEDNCDYIMICNSDILFVDNSIYTMIDYMNQNPNVGITGPQIYNQNDEFQPFYMLIKLTASGKIKNMLLKTPLKKFMKKFESEFILKNELQVPKRVFGVSGCCFIMSYECAKFLFPLDERTFLYEEEYIIGVRLENTGIETYIIPNTHIIHAHGASTGGISRFSLQCLIDSEQLYLKEYLHTSWIMRKCIIVIRKIQLCKVSCKLNKKDKVI